MTVAELIKALSSQPQDAEGCSNFGGCIDGMKFHPPCDNCPKGHVMLEADTAWMDSDVVPTP